EGGRTVGAGIVASIVE
ncbi:hypothetical protein H009_07951, partial [Agrobacterium tumefaciens str. Cherry 2E-2-2]